MLPIVDKPIIQYGVEEALHSGIQNIIIVTGRGKSAIEDHFDVSFELEYLLESRQKKDLLAIVHTISDMINVSYIRQKEALGLGHAVLRAMELVGDEPFSVVLADDVIEAETPCLRQLLDIYSFFCAPVLAVMEVPQREHLGLRLHRCRAGPAQRLERPRVPHSRPGGEAQAVGSAVQPRDHRPLRAHCPRSSIRCRPSIPARAAKSSSPTRCGTCCAAARFTPTASKARATTPAISSGSSKPPSSTRCAGTIWAALSAST